MRHPSLERASTALGALLIAVTCILTAPSAGAQAGIAVPPNLRGVQPAQLRALRLPAVTRSAVLARLRKFPGGSSALARVETVGGSSNAAGSANDATGSISYDATKAEASASAPWINSWITYESVNFGYYGYPLITLRGGQNSDMILMLNPVNATAPIWVVITLDLAGGGLNSGFAFTRTGNGQPLGSCTRAQVQASGGGTTYGSCMVVIQLPPSGLGVKITPDNFISVMRTTITKL